MHLLSVLCVFIVPKETELLEHKDTVLQIAHSTQGGALGKNSRNRTGSSQRWKLIQPNHLV